MDTVSSYIITGLMANFKEIVNLATRKNVPKYLGKTQIKNDEKVVVQHCCHIKSWQSPFEHSDKTVGLSSQIKAPPTVQKDLMNAVTIGENSFKDFIQHHIESNNFRFCSLLRKTSCSILTQLSQQRS